MEHNPRTSKPAAHVAPVDIVDDELDEFFPGKLADIADHDGGAALVGLIILFIAFFAGVVIGFGVAYLLGLFR